jgi:hypothetical protein
MVWKKFSYIVDGYIVSIFRVKVAASHLHFASFLRGLLFDPKDVGGMFL